MLKASVVLLSVFGVCFAAVALMKPDPKPDKFKDVEGCYIKSMDTLIPLGESVPSKTSCMEYSCGTDLVQLISCGVVSTSPPCKVVHYDNFVERPYPKCCPAIEC